MKVCATEHHLQCEFQPGQHSTLVPLEQLASTQLTVLRGSY